MPLSPEQIATKRFVVALRGYDKDEVDSFLLEVSEQVAEHLPGQDGAPVSPGREPSPPSGITDDALRRFAEQIEAVLRSAVTAADQIRARAEGEAEATKASALRAQAEAEAAQAGVAKVLRAAQESEAKAIELQELATRRLAEADAVKQAAEAAASALMTRTAEQADIVRQQMLERLQQSLHDLAGIADPFRAKEGQGQGSTAEVQ
jgi:DivIVA domain-containing protein